MWVLIMVVTNQLVWIGRLSKLTCNFLCWFYISSICAHAKGNCSHAVPVVVSSSGQTPDGLINLFNINYLNPLLFDHETDMETLQN